MWNAGRNTYSEDELWSNQGAPQVAFGEFPAA